VILEDLVGLKSKGRLERVNHEPAAADFRDAADMRLDEQFIPLSPPVKTTTSSRSTSLMAMALSTAT
jgi:hypothetical protein